MSRAPKLPSFIASHLQGANVPPGASKEFCNLIKAIGESGTNHEETRIIAKEAKVLEERLRQPNITKKQMKEYLIRLLYCEMLGKEVSFGYIHAVKFTQHSSLLEKRVGYLAVSLLLHEDHELIYLLVNTIQRDLQSTNIVEICMALTVVCKLINAEMIPAVLQYVVPALGHSREIVRKKAVLALHRFYQRSPSSITHLMPKIRRALYDQDPGVMAASLNLFYDMIVDDASKNKDLVPSFVSVLKQVVEHRLPKDFDYHKVPAPWMQIKLLKILALLGKDDRAASESMYEVLRDCLRRADIQSSAAYAVLYQCVLTCTQIYPSSQLVELAAKSVGRFLRTDNNNLKYLGITALASVVSVNPSYASPHKALVIECLDDPDETLKRKTLDLLCKMTNPANVKVIVEKLLGYLKSTVDTYLRKDLVPRIIELAERYAPDNVWYVETINTLFQTAGDLVHDRIAHNLMRLIAEGTEDDELDAELRVFATESYIELLEEPSLPDVLVQTMAWVVGEYAYLAEDYDQEIVLQLVCDLLNRTYDDEATTKGWIITAIAKLVAQTGLFPNAVRDQLQVWLSSVSSDIQQRCAEVLALVQNGSLMREVLPIDASCEDIEVDEDLSFLDSVVQTALQNGARPYEAHDINIRKEQPAHTTESTNVASTFNFEPYEAPQDPDQASSSAAFNQSIFSNAQADPVLSQLPSHRGAGDASSTGTGRTTPTDASSTAAKPSAASALQVKARRWGRGGDLVKKQQQQAAQEQPSTTEAAEGASHQQQQQQQEDQQQQQRQEEEDRRRREEEAAAKRQAQQRAASRPMDEEKRQLADSIFVSADNAPVSPRTARRSRAKKSRAARGARRRDGGASTAARSAAPVGDLLSLDDEPQQQQQQPSAGDDLMGLDLLGDSQPAVTSTTTASHAQQQDAAGDLLGDFFGSSTTTTAPSATTSSSPPPPSYDNFMSSSLPVSNAQEQQQQQTSGQDLLGGLDDDFGLGGLSMSSSSSQQQQPQYASSSTNGGGGGMDLLSLGGFGESSTDSTGGGDGGLLMPSNSAEATTSASTAGGDGAEDGIPGTLLVKDDNFVVSYVKEQADDCVHVDVHVKNMTSHVSSGLVTKLDGSRGLDRVDAHKLETKFGMKTSAGGSATQRTSWIAASISAGMSIQGQTTYLQGGATRTLRFKIPLSPPDFLRPLSLSTEEFGAMWQSQCTAERAQMITSSPVTTVDDLSSSALETLHLSTVAIIGAEVIMAGQLLNNSDRVCLIHWRVDAPTLHAAVRTKSMPFTEAVLQVVVSSFRS